MMKWLFQRLDLVVFFGSVLAIFYTVGFMTAEYRFFPYEIVRDAKRGLQAWQALENDDFPV